MTDQTTSRTVSPREQQLALWALFAALALFQIANAAAMGLLLALTGVGALCTAFYLCCFTRIPLHGRALVYIAILGLFAVSALWSYSHNPTKLATLRVKEFALWAAWGIGPMLFIRLFIVDGISPRLIAWALIFSTVTTGVTALYLLHYVDDDGRVAIGRNFPTIFGDIASLNGLLCFYLALTLRHSRALGIGLALGCFCALLAAYASGSRGAWLSVIVMLPTILLMHAHTSGRTKLTLLVLGLVGGLGIFAANDIVIARIDLMMKELSDYYARGEQFSSIGLRLDSWKGSVITFMEHPWRGVGDDRLGPAFEPLFRSGQLIDYIKPFEHVHNDLLQMAFSKGIPGILTYAALLALPVLVATPGWKRLALVVSMSYALFGLTDALFTINISTVYYFFLSAVLMNLNAEVQLAGS